MAEAVTLKAEARTGRGSRDAARLRSQGRIPAIVYGHQIDPARVSVPREDLLAVLRHHTRTLQLVIGGKAETVLIQDVQHDYLGTNVIHVDFRRVSADERVRTTVEVELRGVAPGTNSGGVLDQPLHKIHIECPALEVPESIRVKIDRLQVGDVIHIRDLELPKGVRVLEDPDLVVVQVKQQAAMPEPSAAPAAGEGSAAEPEVITKKKEKPAGEEE